MSEPTVQLTADGKTSVLRPDDANIIAVLRFNENVYTIKITNKGRLVMS